MTASATVRVTDDRPAEDRAAHDRLANAIRALAMDAVQAANSGHPGLPMGVADVATVLFTRYLKFDPLDPAWSDRDRFVLSAGHGSMLIYALLHLLGYEKMTIDEIKRFRQLGSITAGHPEHGHTPGVETTTGPLGQGLANAVGMAMAERHLAAAFGRDIVDHHTYVLASDGDLMEGISQEAIALAGHLKLSRLIVLFDDNGISIDGPLSLSDSVDQVKRFEAAGWAASRIDGHDPQAIARAIEKAKASGRPSLIACRTTIGFGAPTKAGSEKSHGSPLGADEVAAARARLAWLEPAFEVPADVREAWGKAGERGQPARQAWLKRLAALAPDTRAEFERRSRGALQNERLAAAVRSVKEKLAAAPKEIATRAASEFALEALVPAIPELLGGSADLTGPTNTKTKGMTVLPAADYGWRFIHYAVRAHGMAPAMTGVARHGRTTRHVSRARHACIALAARRRDDAHRHRGRTSREAGAGAGVQRPHLGAVRSPARRRAAATRLSGLHNLRRRARRRHLRRRVAGAPGPAPGAAARHRRRRGDDATRLERPHGSDARAGAGVQPQGAWRARPRRRRHRASPRVAVRRGRRRSRPAGTHDGDAAASPDTDPRAAPPGTRAPRCGGRPPPNRIDLRRSARRRA